MSAEFDENSLDDFLNIDVAHLNIDVMLLVTTKLRDDWSKYGPVRVDGPVRYAFGPADEPRRCRVDEPGRRRLGLSGTRRANARAAGPRDQSPGGPRPGPSRRPTPGPPARAGPWPAVATVTGELRHWAALAASESDTDSGPLPGCIQSWPESRQ